MGKFESELHTLCEESKWQELCSILESLLAFKESENSDFMSDEDGNSNGDEVAADNTPQHDINQGKGDDPPQNPFEHGRGKDLLKKHQQHSMTQLTSTTVSCVSTEPSETGELVTEGRGLYSQEEECSHGGSGLSDIASSRSCGESIGSSEQITSSGHYAESTTETVVHSNHAPSPQSQSVDQISSPSLTFGNEMSLERASSLQNQLVSREGPNRWTPLMIACMCAPQSVIVLLTKVCPDACGIPDRSGSLPLHFGCWRHAAVSERRKETELTENQSHGSEGNLQQLNSGSSVNSNVKETPQDENTLTQNDVCLVLSILIAAYPDALATANRWGQTPLHSLFETKRPQHPPKSLRIGGNERGMGLSIVEALLGKWSDETWGYLLSNKCAMSHDEVKELKQVIQLDLKRALRTRDKKGKLPLHAVAGCHWANEAILKAVVSEFPPAAWIPVIPPVNELDRSFGKSSTTSSWDINGPIFEEEDEDEESDNNNSSEGLFPLSGGCHGKDIAVHILHRKFLSPISSASVNHSTSSYNDFPDEDGVKSCVTDASIFLDERHCAEISALLEPLVTACNDSVDISSRMEARLACAATGSGQSSETERKHSALRSHYSSFEALSSTLLPVHIGSIHGVSFEILHGLCCAYPEGVRTPMKSSLHADRHNLLPIELFEEGRAGHEVSGACNSTFPSLMAEYFRRSDLLFSYFPEAVSSKNVQYCKDEVRLQRFKKMIQEEARDPNPDVPFSDMAGSVWIFMCRSGSATRKSDSPGGNSNSRKSTRSMNFGAVIGQILDGLGPQSIQKLSHVRTVSAPEGVRIPSLACTGRSVLEEARERAPKRSVRAMLNEPFFFSSVLSFLNARDALAFSSTCWKARASGVRLLPAVSGDESEEMDSIWSLDFPGITVPDVENKRDDVKILKLWQKLDISCVPSCTHTIQISYDVHVNNWENGRKKDGGGLFVVRDTRSKSPMPLCTAADLDTLKAVVASNPEDDSGNLRLSVPHTRGRSYTLWVYGYERQTLTITNLRVQQLVYACDYNGHNPLHSLINEGDNPSNLRNQISMLVSAGFGSSNPRNAVGELPIHYALKVGALEKALRYLIEMHPSALLYTDNKKRTPLHAVFDLPSSGAEGKLPHLGVVQTLLTPPGNSAAQLKDSTGRLPLHIAAEKGAGEGLLRLLVDAYADGCYRQTDVGDLPLHLLARSGKATQATVELLTRPMMDNPTICSYAGSEGVNLPLHIACQYRCKYDVIEGLLNSYNEASKIRRHSVKPEKTSSRGPRHKKPAEYALAIFEEGRGVIEGNSLGKEMSSAVKRRDSMRKKGSALKTLDLADFDLRSDLIFVHNPDVPKTELPYMPTFYRDEPDRLERLKSVIRREAIECSRPTKSGSDDVALTEMAKLAWIWMCSDDNYSMVVYEIVNSLPRPAVEFLSKVKNPQSVSQKSVLESSAPKCGIMITTRLSFLRRYLIDCKATPIHKSESSIVMQAKDIGAMEEFLLIQNRLGDYEPDIDDYSHTCGTVYGIHKNSVEIDLLLRFAQKLGLDRSFVIDQVENLTEEFGDLDDEASKSSLLSDIDDIRHVGVKQAVFDEFCRLHGIDKFGQRDVVIKFMKNQRSYELEQECRALLNESDKSNHTAPMLLSFFLEEEDDDERRAVRDFDLLGFKYGIVMRCADRDLGDIFYRESAKPSYLRDNAKRIGEALHALHEKGIIYLDLQLKNILRFEGQMLLSDFGSSQYLKSIDGIDAIGGCSTKICPSLMPPEMVARIPLGDSFNNFNEYWSHVSNDATTMCAFSPHERQDISECIESLLRAAKSPLGNIGHSDSEGKYRSNLWKESISSSLETLDFDDLPNGLSQCSSVSEFFGVWERMQSNLTLWERIIRPRVDERKDVAYALKVFDDRPGAPHDISTLPFQLVKPSIKVDVWMFGIFLFELCSGGNPFHIGYQGELRGVDAYEHLCNWETSAAKRNIEENVHDPLAQDLLCRILLPENKRLPDIASALKHPFFSPTSTEAERFLEKFDEMQSLRKETIIMSKVSKHTQSLMENSMEKYCRIGFASDRNITIPSCLVVLPYDVEWIESINRPVTSLNPDVQATAERLGHCLLEINKAVSRLSFWMAINSKMRGKDGDDFKSQMKNWLKLARSHPGQIQSIAIQIVESIDCAPTFKSLCEEVLTLDSNISKAKPYMKDPMRAARKAIRENSDDLAMLYGSMSIYLVDEVELTPSVSDSRDSAFPIRLDSNEAQLKNTLLPFMNIAVMKALARDKFDGLIALLGLPPTFQIPDSWKKSEPGLVHTDEHPFSMEQFTLLQRSLRQSDLDAFLANESVANASMRDSFHSGRSSCNEETSTAALSMLGSSSIDINLGDPASDTVPMIQLESIFRDFDPKRTFGGLKRVSTGIDSAGIWTSQHTIKQWESEVEMVDLEQELEKLKVDLERRKESEIQMKSVLDRLDRMKSKEDPSGDRMQDESHCIDSASCTSDNHFSSPDPRSGDHSITSLKSEQDDQNNDEGAEGRKQKKKKRRFRPWFGAC